MKIFRMIPGKKGTKMVPIDSDINYDKNTTIGDLIEELSQYDTIEDNYEEEECSCGCNCGCDGNCECCKCCGNCKNCKCKKPSTAEGLTMSTHLLDRRDYLNTYNKVFNHMAFLSNVGAIECNRLESVTGSLESPILDKVTDLIKDTTDMIYHMEVDRGSLIDDWYDLIALENTTK